MKLLPGLTERRFTIFLCFQVQLLDASEAADQQRECASHIYYLIPRGSYSAFHRLRLDELWHHYVPPARPGKAHQPGGRSFRQGGNPVRIVGLSEEGGLRSENRLGRLEDAAAPFAVVPNSTWFAVVSDDEGEVRQFL